MLIPVFVPNDIKETIAKSIYSDSSWSSSNDFRKCQNDLESEWDKEASSAWFKSRFDRTVRLNGLPAALPTISNFQPIVRVQLEEIQYLKMGATRYYDYLLNTPFHVLTATDAVSQLTKEEDDTLTKVLQILFLDKKYRMHPCDVLRPLFLVDARREEPSPHSDAVKELEQHLYFWYKHGFKHNLYINKYRQHINQVFGKSKMNRDPEQNIWCNMLFLFTFCDVDGSRGWARHHLASRYLKAYQKLPSAIRDAYACVLVTHFLKKFNIYSNLHLQINATLYDNAIQEKRFLHNSIWKRLSLGNTNVGFHQNEVKINDWNVLLHFVEAVCQTQYKGKFNTYELESRFTEWLTKNNQDVITLIQNSLNDKSYHKNIIHDAYVRALQND